MIEKSQQMTLDEQLGLRVKEEVRLEQERLQEILRQERERQIAAKKEKEERDLIFAQTALEVVASHYGVSIEQMTSGSRSREVKQPRNTAQYIIFKNTDFPLLKISDFVGRVDHTTAINSIKRIDKRLEFDEDLRNRIGEMQEEITRQTALRFYVPVK